MTDEKQIEEMAKIVGWHCNEKSMDYCDTVDDCDECLAIDLYNAGYRKLPEDSVVLTVEEIERLKKSISDFDTTFIKHFENTIRKETAREILQELYYCPHEYHDRKIQELAKQFGVEVE